jgi:homoserine dehydrogenase
MSSTPVSSTLRIGIAGLGTVGAAVADILVGQHDRLAERAGRPVALTAVSARNKDRDRGVDLSGMAWEDDPVALATRDDIDLFVELIGGEEGPARASVEAALSRGIPVVTANKALLARHGMELAPMAEAAGVTIAYEAAVAGGIPAIKTMREAASANRIDRVFGILNGTCNYILTRMEHEGLAFDDVLEDAQAQGYAEADPTADVEGHDTAHKLALLASLAFGTEINMDAVYLEGISSITSADIEAAAELGYRIKLLGVATRTETGIEQRVTPAMVPLTSAMAQVNGVLNAVAVNGDQFGEIVLSGAGAGGAATASAVVSDIVDLARGNITPPLGIPVASIAPHKRARMRAHEGGYYISLRVHDRPGAMAGIATRMAERGISIQSIVQKGQHLAPALAGQTAVTVTLITHETTEELIRAAIDDIEADGQIEGRTQMIRIEQP